MRHLAPALACLPVLAAQAPNPPHLAIPRLAQPPSMARDADLSTWKGALEITDFGMIMPDDKGENRWPTIVHVGWGPDALYVAVEAKDPDPAKIHAARHMRDTNSGDFDFVGVDLDPSGKGQSIIRLFVTPLGGQIDEIMTDSTGENSSYDCLWDSTGVLTPDGYVVKMRVPYSSLRRMPGEWAMRFLRIIPRERRYGISWPRMSKDIQCDICQMARVSGAPVTEPGSPFLLIPFATFNRTQTLEADPGAPAQSKTQLGADLRYATTALTLEGTYRPDFATADADVDPLQINSRFKVFYPERRPFFLEGMDLLGPVGAQRQFFSRSIQNPLYGVKASGQASLASWTVVHAKDQDGGLLLGANGAAGVDGMATRDTAAAMRFELDGRGSGLSLLGTDKRLQGGPDATGGQSGGIYLDQYLGTEFHFIGSALAATSRLPQADGTTLSQRGTSTYAELDWNTRHWFASANSQTTSPGLVLVSGFTDLQGYRQQNATFGWQGTWNGGRFSQANASLRGRHLEWWDGHPFDRAVGLSAYVETAGRWAWSLDWDVAGRTWADDEVTSNATRNINMALSWKKYGWAQLLLRRVMGRTIDLASGAPARLRTTSFTSNGAIGDVCYQFTAQRTDLDRESDSLRLVRARKLSTTATYQMPRFFYLKAQAFVVRYDGSEFEGVDKYLKAFLGWQPNAFTNAYLGWSGQRHRDPLAVIPTERMVERGLFAKVAYALQF
ncbi:hypothetical protein GETHPA_09790 [Geothrix rubra]|uniref:DUF5916 domain-containing protein n=1 Tax=Geothrix rubra TaxID=2927977 RepID=A0ABQ5Q543_9BACT|nr:DUF5916 domain-containing protein [Geothrix rubra]GLH69446.1 hypothetical protein GETHPA_09790 [Geothrix rubra]